MEDIHKLQQLSFERLSKGEKVTIEDLYPYSKIKLRKKRNRIKFNKYYYRYVSEKVVNVYWGIQIAYPLVNATKKILSFDLIPELETLNGPTGEFVYLDFKYKPENK